MALFDNALDVMATALCGEVSHVQFHSGAPGTGGSNVISGGRFPATLVTDGDGNISLDEAVAATGLTPSATVHSVTLWDAATAGTCYGFAPRTSGDAAVNAAGEYTLTAVNIPGSSS